MFQKNCIDNISSKSQKKQRLINFISPPQEQHLPFKETGTTTIFSFGYHHVFGHVVIHSFDKTHDLVVTVELIWLLLLNMLSFNFVPTPNKFLLD